MLFIAFIAVLGTGIYDLIQEGDAAFIFNGACWRKTAQNRILILNFKIQQKFLLKCYSKNLFLTRTPSHLNSAAKNPKRRRKRLLNTVQRTKCLHVSDIFSRSLNKKKFESCRIRWRLIQWKLILMQRNPKNSQKNL